MEPGLTTRRFHPPRLDLPGLQLGLPRVEVIDHFVTNKDAVPDGAGPVFDRLVRQLGLYQGDVFVSGHTDSTFTPDYNKDLSTRRARNVAQELVHLGIDASRLHVEGFGETELLYQAERTPEEKARNRRVNVSYRVPLPGLDESLLRLSPELRLSLEPPR